MKFVKINASRGYGDDVWEVIATNGDSYTLKNTRTAERKEMYKAHTYFDKECSAVNRACAKSIGMPKKKPGKK